MAKWAVKDKAEFEARQGFFDFAVVARAVVELKLGFQKKLRAMFSTWKKGFRTFDTVKKPHQLVLELDAIAQIPLVFA